MGKPFRVTSPAPVPSTGETKAAAPPGQNVVRSNRTGDPLPDASKDTPSHSPTIAWPPAQSDRAPMKLNK